MECTPPYQQKICGSNEVTSYKSSAKETMEFTCSEYRDMAMSTGASGGQAPCILPASNIDVRNVVGPNQVRTSDSRFVDVDILAALSIEVSRADEAPECKGRGKREIPEKTRRPAASSGTIPAWRKSASDTAGDYSPSTKANWVRFPVRPLPDSHMWGSCRKMPGLLGDLPLLPPLHSGAAHTSSSSALKTPMLRSGQISSLAHTHSRSNMSGSAGSGHNVLGTGQPYVLVYLFTTIFFLSCACLEASNLQLFLNGDARVCLDPLEVAGNPHEHGRCTTRAVYQVEGHDADHSVQAIIFRNHHSSAIVAL
ncbi:hypothetical protein PR048_031623 [Dryococelus australis]|uniref:Uncharacterized protein n=1 Tax=Dryococelus australis TaxID=614101 RepID=A0ABQ9G5T3_9NEOP|nr:hypothetical protein PR048_031623 [Dryococelus australis]